MTYSRSIEYVTDIESAIINCKTPSSTSAGGVFSLSGTATSNASISSNQLVLAADYHYYLESSILCRNSSFNGQVEWSFYDVNASSYIGQTGFYNIAVSLGNDPRVGRRCARALILNSGSNRTVDCRIKAISGTNWNFTVTASGLSGFNFVGYPSLRIWELPA